MLSLYVGIGLALLAIYLIISNKHLAPWFPTRKSDFKRINRLSELERGQVFYDLGCGDGRVCVYMARNNPEVKVVGIELSVIFFSIAILRKWLSGLSNLEFRLGDVYKQNFSEADVIYTFAMIGSVNGRLKDKILEEIKLESKLISYVFSIKKWQGQTLIDDTGEFGNKIHVYIKNKKIN